MPEVSALQAAEETEFTLTFHPEQLIEFQCEHGPKGMRATAVKAPLDLTGVAA